VQDPNEVLNLTRPQRVQLAGLADIAIRSALAGELGVPAASNLFEAIGATVSTALPATGDDWQGVLQPLGVRVDVVGAFSFGCPKVELVGNGPARRCDLGSVLAIVDDLTAPVPDRRALFFSSRLLGDEAEPAQRKLYAEWPAFRFMDDAYRDGWRDLQASDAEPAGCFVEIDLTRGRPAWTLLGAAAAGRPRLRPSVGAALADMTVGVGGRKAIPDGPDAWSQLVDELLKRTARATVGGPGPELKVRSTAIYKGQCGSGFVVFENREELPLKSAIARAVGRGHVLVEGPMSIVHFVLRSRGHLDS
jgi:hypothetical protein